MLFKDVFSQPKQRVLLTAAKPLLHCLALLPCALLAKGLLSDTLGVNPVETLTHNTGEWGLRFLLITLCISPLVKISGAKWLMQWRRPLGLYCAFYVLMHFLIYFVFDQSLTLRYVMEDIEKRPFITVGFVGFLLLIPLAATSPLSIRRRMGRRWVKLHRLIYVIGVAAIIHLLWLTKADFGPAWVYGTLFVVLVALRLPFNAGRGKTKG